jgi:hypothetical protein
MPSRVIDGDKMHQSDKIAALPGWAQPEYPWIYPLADANGVLELTNLRAVYARAYAIRSRFSFAKFTKLIQLFNKSVGLLFIWEADGKRYGYWTGAERRGRLPSLSTRARYNPIGILPPADQLRTYYKRFGIRTDVQVTNQSRLNHDAIVTGVGVGLGVGKGKETEKSKPSCSPSANEVSGDVSQSSHPDPEFSPSGMELACLLRQRILENNSRARITEKHVVAWGHQADLMIRVDHRTAEEISALIEWSQRDSFWRGNILSMRKLREQFDQLTVKSRAKQELGQPAWKRREREAEKKQVEAVHTIFELSKKAGK